MPSAIAPIGSLAQRTDLAFEQAVYSVGEVIEHEIAVADCRIRLKFAGQALVGSITHALEHLTCGLEEQPDLRVQLWDEASTQVGFPFSNGAEDLPANGKLVFIDPDTESLALSVKLESGIVSMLDVERSHSTLYVPDATHLPTSEMGAPLLSILHGLFSTRNALIAHAAAVGTLKGGVLLVGRGGSGKSTTALACVQAGLGYIADDYCLLTVGTGITAHCLYGSAKVDAAGLRRLGMQETVAGSSHTIEEKNLLFVNEQWPEHLLRSCPVRAVLLPHIRSGAETVLKPVSALVALRSLAPSTILQLPGSSSRLLKMMARVVKEVPCYMLEIGDDIAQAPVMIRQLLEKLQ